MMFIEMASYIGDVLGYYIDDTLKESLMLYAEDKENVIALAQYLGYKPKVSSPAVYEISVYQLVPSIYNSNSKSGTNYEPDSRFYLRIKEGMEVEASNGVLFRTTELLDFNDETEREISVLDQDGNTPTAFLIKKYVNVISAELKEISINFSSTPSAFSKIQIADTNVIDIYDVRDFSGNKWYEVPYLAQETVYVDYGITEKTDMDLNEFRGQPNTASNVLKLIKTSRRFVKQVNEDNTTTIVFGGGSNTSGDETFIPNLKNVGLGLPNSIT